jgi:putative tryptophan/tyrosine transport system substrate-binding protein
VLEDTTMPLRTIGLLLALAFGLDAVLLAADAQPMKKMPRIGVLSVESPPARPDGKPRFFFLQELRNLGWIEGQNIAVEARWASGSDGRLADLAVELVRLNVDVIVAPDRYAIPAAKQATTAIPIDMLSPVDPLAAGYVVSLARRGGNIAGVGGLVQELSGKPPELLKEAVPEVTRVAVLAGPAQPDIERLLREAEDAARALDVRPHALEARHPRECERAFEAATQEGDGALLILPALLASLRERRLAALAVKHRLPAIYTRRSFAEAGGLLTYGPKRASIARLAAYYVDPLLKGAKPADLPVERLTTFELLLNPRTAQALGLALPPTLFFQAGEVIR